MTSGTVPPADNDDLSRQIRARYDTRNLYLAVRVRDSSIQTDSADPDSKNGNTSSDPYLLGIRNPGRGRRTNRWPGFRLPHGPKHGRESEQLGRHSDFVRRRGQQHRVQLSPVPMI